MSSALVPHNSVSVVIPAAKDKVWAAILNLNFSWWPIVTKVTPLTEGADPRVVGGFLLFEFKDGCKVEYQVNAIDIDHYTISLAAVLFHPKVEGGATLNHSGRVHTIRLFEVTMTGGTFVKWETEFSSDVDMNTLTDCKCQKEEGMAGLLKHFTH